MSGKKRSDNFLSEEKRKENLIRLKKIEFSASGSSDPESR